MPYDLTYMWNLINKTSKQNTTRDIEIKNNVTVIRGEGGGYSEAKKGKGGQGTRIKEPWTKTMQVGKD